MVLRVYYCTRVCTCTLTHTGIVFMGTGRDMGKKTQGLPLSCPIYISSYDPSLYLTCLWLLQQPPNVLVYIVLHLTPKKSIKSVSRSP